MDGQNEAGRLVDLPSEVAGGCQRVVDCQQTDETKKRMGSRDRPLGTSETAKSTEAAKSTNGNEVYVCSRSVMIDS